MHCVKFSSISGLDLLSSWDNKNVSRLWHVSPGRFGGHSKGVVFWNHPDWAPLASCYINLAYKTQYGDQHPLLIGSFSSYPRTQLILVSQLYGCYQIQGPRYGAPLDPQKLPPLFLQICCDSLAPEAWGLHANSSPNRCSHSQWGQPDAPVFSQSSRGHSVAAGQGQWEGPASQPRSPLSSQEEARLMIALFRVIWMYMYFNKTWRNNLKCNQIKIHSDLHN